MKKLLTILFVALMTIGVNAHPVSAQKAEAGEVWMAAAYCLDLDDAKHLSARMVEDGVDGYIEVMAADGNMCWDTRMSSHAYRPGVTIVEKLWTITTSQGQVFDFWSAGDGAGVLTWVWFEVPGEDT